jgi:hypothetical protein
MVFASNCLGGVLGVSSVPWADHRTQWNAATVECCHCAMRILFMRFYFKLAPSC